MAAMWAGDLDSPGGVREAAKAARAAPPGPDPPRGVDLLLDAFALRLTEGYSAAAPTLTRALEPFLALNVANDDVGRWRWSATIALELWDFESWHALAARQAQFARDTGALVQLQFALNLLAWTHHVAGDSTAAAQLIEEERLIAEATGNPPLAYTEMMLAAWRGREAQASEPIEATLGEATAGGLGVNLATYASSVLDNGLGRHDAARERRVAIIRARSGGVRALCRARAGRGGVQDRRRRVRPGRTRVALRAHTRDADRVGAGDRSPRPRPAERGRGRRQSLPRVDRAARPNPRPQGARPRPSALRRVAATRAPPRGRARAAAQRPRDAGHDGHRGVRRAGPARAARPRARPPASARWRGATSSRLRRGRSRGSPATGSRTPRSAPGCSSARARSSTTCTRSSPSSRSARATSSSASCPASRPPSGRSSRARQAASRRRRRNTTGHSRCALADASAAGANDTRRAIKEEPWKNNLK